MIDYQNRKKPVCLSRIYQNFECGKISTYSLNEVIADAVPLCCKYRQFSDGGAYTKPIPTKVISFLRERMQGITKCWKEDFIRDDETLNKYEGRFIWGCRENGTDLLLFDLVPLDAHQNKETTKDQIVWIVGSKNDRSEEIYYWDMEQLHKITNDQAKQLWENHCNNISSYYLPDLF